MDRTSVVIDSYPTDELPPELQQRGEFGAQVRLVGVDLGEAGTDQDVVESEGEREVRPGHAVSKDRNEVDGTPSSPSAEAGDSGVRRL